MSKDGDDSDDNDNNEGDSGIDNDEDDGYCKINIIQISLPINFTACKATSWASVRAAFRSISPYIHIEDNIKMKIVCCNWSMIKANNR